MAIAKSIEKVFVYSFAVLLFAVLLVGGLIYYQFQDLDRVKALAVERLEELTGREIVIGQAELDIVEGLSVHLHKVSVGDHRGEKQQFQADSVWVVVKLIPLLDKRVEIEKIIVQGTSLELVRDDKGRFNLGDPLRQLGEPGSEWFQLLTVSIMSQLMVRGGEVRFVDYYRSTNGKPTSLLLEDVNLSIRRKFLKTPYSFNLHAKLPNSNRPTRVSITGLFDPLAATGGFYSVPVQAKVRVDQLHVPKFKPYFQKIISFLPEDSLLSLESEFSGKLGENLSSEGELKYSFQNADRGPVLRDIASTHRGTIKYDLDINRKQATIKKLDIHSGSMEFHAHGEINNWRSPDPRISLFLKSSPFQIASSQNYLPLMIFPKEMHRAVHSRLVGGTVELESWGFEGTYKQLLALPAPESLDRISGKIRIRQTNWGSPLPPLKKMSGEFEWKSRRATVVINKAQYEGLPISNVKGTIRNFIHDPAVDLTMENEVPLEQFKKTLQKLIKGESYENVLDDYRDMEGNGLLKINFKSSDGFKKIKMAGTLLMENAALYEAEMKTRIENMKGTVKYVYDSDNNQDHVAAEVPIIEFSDFSGQFDQSSFSRMKGSVKLKGDIPVREMYAVYNLGMMELPGLVSDLSYDGPLMQVLKEASITGGSVDVHYHSTREMRDPVREKESGRVELKNLSLKHPSGFQPLLNLTGNVHFKVGVEHPEVRIEKVKGWYGNSPVELQGKLWSEGEGPGFSVKAVSTDFVQADLKDIPFLQTLAYSGPAHTEIQLEGTLDKFSIKQSLDLTRVAYHYQDKFKKAPSTKNTFKVDGHYGSKQGVVLENLEYVLGPNKITGNGRVKSFQNPEFAVSLNSRNFKIQPLVQSVSLFQGGREGELDFKIQGRGNFSEFQDTSFDGHIGLREVVIRPENKTNSVKVGADLHFSGDRWDIRDGTLESDRSKMRFSGLCSLSEKPAMEIKLAGDTLVLEEVLPASGTDSETDVRTLLAESPFFSKGISKVSVNLSRLDYKLFTLNEVSGDFLVKDRELKIRNLKIGPEKLIRGTGSFSVEETGPMRLNGRLVAKNIPARQLTGMFGNVFKDGLTGQVEKFQVHFNGRGETWKEVSDSFGGSLSVNFKSGEINHQHLKEGALQVFAVTPANEPASGQAENTTYDHIKGDFVYANGIAETGNFVYDTDQRRSSIVGKFDLKNSEMDIVLGVAPLVTLDRFLTKIPVVGKIITAGDEESLLKNYYTVKGSFNDPDITPIPFTSLGRKLMGTFQGILQTPQEILTLPEAALSDESDQFTN